MTPSYGDLGLLPTDMDLYPNVSLPSYIVVEEIHNPLICLCSSIVSGYSTFENDVTLMTSLNVSGHSNFKDHAKFSTNLNVSGYSVFKDNATFGISDLI